jgi:ribosome silencing factor RsfS/YbeB/iojap
VPIAVFDRPSYSLKALSGPAAERFARHRVSTSEARRLAGMEPPAWVFFHNPLDDRSATRIRLERKEIPLHTQKEQRSELSTITALALIRPIEAHQERPNILDLVLQTLDDGKAEEIVTIDLAGKTTIADHMVIASGRSTRQVLALTEHLEEVLSRRIRISIEGKTQGDWVLIDAGDVIVHLFRPEIRSYYNLEKMWGSAMLDSEAVRL